MADAVRGGDVHAADPEQTIDAASPPAEPAPAGLPAAIVAATRDYQELAAVERHHYAITKEIARGGIGRVFEARDLRLGRQVAIKELLPKNRDAARRFEREARITARLQHPAIIHVYEAGVWPGGEPFYAMPLVSGRSLDKVVAERKTLDERLGLLPNVIAVADALAYAHNANVIHRDLKPANVLVGEFGETVVIDWGLAKDLGSYSDPKESLQIRLRVSAEETMSGSVVGTPAYMPPEQARGDAVDQRADVYALGALLYKVLTGAAPYTGASSSEVVEQVKTRSPVPAQEREPSAPPDLLAIVAKAMARDPDDRYITASELAQDLKRFETGQLVGAHRYTAGELVRRWIRRHRLAMSIAAAALVALIVLGVVSLQQIVVEKDRADAARDNANARRANLLEERARIELLGGQAGAALANLVGAIEADKPTAVRRFLIADAMRQFDAELVRFDIADGDVAIAVSADGRRIVAGGAGEIQLRASDGALVRSFGRHGTMTRAVAFDATGSVVAAAGDDGIARVWSVDGALLAELRGHDGAVLALVFSSDGKRLVTTGEDSTVRIWDLATKQARKVDCHIGPVTSARLSPDGEKVLTASADSNACIIYISINPPTEPRTDRKLKGHTAAINDARWNADGTLVVTASDDGTARVWDAALGKPIVDSLRHEPGSTLAVALITPDGFVVTGGSDQTVRVWELPNVVATEGVQAPPVKLRRKLVGHSARIVAAAYSAEHNQLATGGFDGLAKLWDLGSGQQIATFEHGDIVSEVGFVPGATMWLATASREGRVRIWNTQAAKTPVNLDSAINAVAIASSGTVAVGLDDSNVKLLADGVVAELHGHLGSVRALGFTADGRLISAGDDASAIIWDVASRKQLATFAPVAGDAPAPVDAIAIDGDRVGLVRAGKIEIWSLATRARTGELAVAERRIDALAFNPATGAIAGVGHDGTFAVWSSEGKLLGERRGPPYNAVAFAPDGTAVVTAGTGVVHVWTVVYGFVGNVDVTLEGGMGVVRSVLVTPDSSRVITAGDNGRAMIWDRDKGKLLGTRDRHDKAISALALRGDTLWIASEDHTLNAWDVRVEEGKVPALQAFMKEHVPVQLDIDDVVRKRTR
ncbi:MAG TPA: protein kinase [Kofleriaceae bacterium]